MKAVPNEQFGSVIVRQFETICRALLRGPDSVIEPEYLRFVTGEAHPLGNFVMLADAENDAAAARAVEPLLTLGVPSAVIVPGAPGTGVEAFLVGQGYGLAESMPAMAVEIDRLTPATLPEGYDFVEVAGDADRVAWIDAFAAGYEIPHRVSAAFFPEDAGAGRASIRWFAVVHAGRMVATSMLFVESDLAGIYGVSTVPEARGRGLGSFMTAEPLRMAQQSGLRTGILQSSAMGEGVYRKLGFEQHGVMPLYVRMPG